MADFFEPEMLKEKFPFSKLAGKSQYLDFPNLDSAITYKLLKEPNQCDSIGIMLGNG
jgi:malate dehydrogenase (oxaloacetate-decarboxylating)(NADP+)